MGAKVGKPGNQDVYADKTAPSAKDSMMENGLLGGASSNSNNNDINVTVQNTLVANAANTSSDGYAS